MTEKITTDEPLEALAACHRRIEAQLATLERLAAVGEAETARAVLRYFDTAGVQHHRDEDEDLFPLLRHLAAERGRPEVAALIGILEREHATMDLQWLRLRQQLDLLAQGRAAALDPGEVARFAWLYRRHTEQEAAAVLPFAKEALTLDQRAALGRRMAARRAATADLG
jgi:hemerythrin-like domain-containing protein